MIIVMLAVAGLVSACSVRSERTVVERPVPASTQAVVVADPPPTTTVVVPAR
ncbi:MAG: hypothetical protein ACKOEC_12790 [Acidimicrobiia bacterium]